ncbi:MAG: Pyridoxamine 5'-phosphate oxidase (EC [uncultured Sulfurovum sp.]|uniref:Pyridoxamine 5'-phosphate oxidase n=1 Tax=uncultured Sulfurovum sp. TaxID=269237 RepID=A0A6S6SQ69_9BACT|nr:MAG: Pyridoxamine 5'-phosphate oxidase (EC [uncultured Sulfurovum sp.]
MADLSTMREEYTTKGLHRQDIDENPFGQFELWFNQAVEAKLIEPNAMTLSTVGTDLKPSQRTVLMKRYDEEGLVFFSNYGSKKSKQIAQNSHVAVHFAWLGLERQLRIEGTIEEISKSASLKYFLSRPRGSQIGAWVSHQSEVVTSRSILEEKFDQMRSKFAKGEIPFPERWGGYLIRPSLFEFWQGGKDRLHDRFEYHLEDNGVWSIKRLEP